MLVLPDRIEEIDALKRVHLLYQRGRTQPVVPFPTTDAEIETARRNGHPIIPADWETLDIPFPSHPFSP